jgi:tetratricopeptide (TPR) repeat protein
MDHAKCKKITPCCPICRGPIQKESVKSLWKEVQEHAKLGKILKSIGVIPYRTETDASLSYLSIEVEREYNLAATKLEKCLELIKKEAASRGSDRNNAGNQKRKFQVMFKLQDILQYTTLDEFQVDRRVDLLRNAILLSNKPVPDAHLELGKVLQSREREDVDLAIIEYQIILDLAKRSRLSTKNKKARKLRGQAHFGIASCHQILGKYDLAAEHYDQSDKYKGCKDYGLAAKCQWLAGNLEKAIYNGKKALKAEAARPFCDTHLIVIRIYETFFQREKTQGTLQKIKDYKYKEEYDHFVELVVTARELSRTEQERNEIRRHVESFKLLLPWKADFLLPHFPPTASCLSSDVKSHECSTSLEDSDDMVSIIHQEEDSLEDFSQEDYSSYDEKEKEDKDFDYYDDDEEEDDFSF